MASTEGSPCQSAAEKLVSMHAASRMYAKDATLYGFDAAAQEYSAGFMGWADLASRPPVGMDTIDAFAEQCSALGFESVALIAEGGSFAAAWTIANYRDPAAPVRFFALDSDSPVCLHEALDELDLGRTLFIVSSKSGGTIEVRSLLCAVRQLFAERLPGGDMARNLVAITDPGSPLEQMAHDQGWLAVFPGEPTVGGRFSALSVFGLVPAAVMGVDVVEFVRRAQIAEELCSRDSLDNPAIGLAAFLYGNYVSGRAKTVLLAPGRSCALGLWIEQLVAESLGKDGIGILPGIEPDPSLLSRDQGDRTIIVYRAKTEPAVKAAAFEASLGAIDAALPRREYAVDSVEGLAEHFVMWEYAVALCGCLMQVCPFDQPDVQQAKTNVLHILADGAPEPDSVDADLLGAAGPVEIRLAPCFAGAADARAAVGALLASIQPGDYFCLNAFLPMVGDRRRAALERMRHAVAARTGAVSCLEVGPRFLHSSGQLYKGGPNTGVFLVLSADEADDIPLPGEKAPSLGSLAKAQAIGDAVTLAQRGRRVVHLHLPDHSGAVLDAVADVVEGALR